MVSSLVTGLKTDRISVIKDRINSGCIAVRLKLKAAMRQTCVTTAAACCWYVCCGGAHHVWWYEIGFYCGSKCSPNLHHIRRGGFTYDRLFQWYLNSINIHFYRHLATINLSPTLLLSKWLGIWVTYTDIHKATVLWNADLGSGKMFEWWWHFWFFGTIWRSFCWET